MNDATMYKRSVISPLQFKPKHPIELMRQKVADTQDEEHPVRKEIQRVVGTYQLSATVAEDKMDIATLRSIPGLVAFICSIKNASGEIIGIGRGSVALGRNQKFLEKAVHSAFNFSLLSAVAQSSRCLDAIVSPRLGDMSIEETGQENIIQECTSKQKSYLTELVQKKIRDEDALVWWMNQINSGMSKNDASSAIQELSGK